MTRTRRMHSEQQNTRNSTTTEIARVGGRYAVQGHSRS